jgi:hypothetical protein
MSGLEVIGGISAIIGIIDASIKIYDSARKDVRLSETFQTVGRRLPVILDTLRTCQTQLEPIKASMSADVCEALEHILEGCDEKARNLREICEKVIPGERDAWEKRYLKVIKRLGKGSKVEELMLSITEDVQLVVNHHAVKSAKPEQNIELSKIIEEMKAVESSVHEESGSGMTFKSDGGNMANYINQDSGNLVVNHERVQNQHFGNGKN